MNTYSYKDISKFGPQTQSPVNNPLTYCLGNSMDQRFLHGSNADIYGQHSRPCQLFLSQYCAGKWDQFCEIASKDKSTQYPNQAGSCINCNTDTYGYLTAGESLILNTAATKYLVKMHGAHKKYEPFDPTVPTSPMISYWVNDNCSYYKTGIPEYAVDPKKIDDDVVMDKILQKPIIAMNILINIYNTMKRYGTLKQLQNTKLGRFYNSHPYFIQKGGLK